MTTPDQRIPDQRMDIDTAGEAPTAGTDPRSARAEQSMTPTQPMAPPEPMAQHEQMAPPEPMAQHEQMAPPEPMAQHEQMAPPDPIAQHEQMAPRPEPTSVNESVGTESQAETTNGEALFATNDLSGLRSRWDDVQATFVDDPRDCVERADALVSDVVERLTNGFTEARSRLEAQWARGEEASTEDLRIALKRYREFFQRLLAV
jgi:hypothetical protein